MTVCSFEQKVELRHVWKLENNPKVFRLGLPLDRLGRANEAFYTQHLASSKSVPAGLFSR